MTFGKIGARRMIGRVGDVDIFADWYPRWGTSDLILALNGIYNQGRDLPHDNNATAWTDISSGIIFNKYKASISNLLWNSNGISFDSTDRTILGNIDLANAPGVTVNVCAYFGTNWGDMVLGFPSSIAPTNYIMIFMPSGNNVGAQIELHKSANDIIYYQQSSRPTTSDLCFTCDASGSVNFYANGNFVKTDSFGATGLSKLQSMKKICIGGQMINNTASQWFPNGSALYGVTIYSDVLSAAEIATLHQANFLNYNLV